MGGSMLQVPKGRCGVAQPPPGCGSPDLVFRFTECSKGLWSITWAYGRQWVRCREQEAASGGGALSAVPQHTCSRKKRFLSRAKPVSQNEIFFRTHI